MKLFKQVALFLLSGLLFLACNQDPIFFEVSLEVAPIPPRISGAPTNIVQVDNKMYVASKRGSTIHQYTSSGWSTPLPSPGGKIIELAATTANLYALVGEPGAVTLKCLTLGSSTWQNISGSGNVQTIYGAGEKLFAGAMTGTNYAIYYDNNGTLTLLKADTQLLKGAGVDGSKYYRATSGGGIFIYESSVTQATGVSATANVVGIINANGTIVAVGRNGYGVSDYILHGNSSGFNAVDTGVKFTGAMATYEKGGVNLLLLGIQLSSTSTTYGYRELVLNEDGSPVAFGLQIPGEAESSVSDEDQYTVTIGAQPLSAIFQAKDGTPFASTVQEGLWSYREHDGKEYWNTEG
jgi:hypothetical protein